MIKMGLNSGIKNITIDGKEYFIAIIGPKPITDLLNGKRNTVLRVNKSKTNPLFNNLPGQYKKG